MLFALTLGLVIGGAAVVLVQQWLSGTLLLTEEGDEALPVERFPHLAPSRHRRAA
jgi:hypothetical protein